MNDGGVKKHQATIIQHTEEPVAEHTEEPVADPPPGRPGLEPRLPSVML
jgi:hypothetical protein